MVYSFVPGDLAVKAVVGGKLVSHYHGFLGNVHGNLTLEGLAADGFQGHGMGAPSRSTRTITGFFVVPRPRGAGFPECVRGLPPT